MNKKCRGGECKGIEEIMVDEIKDEEYDIKVRIKILERNR